MTLMQAVMSLNQPRNEKDAKDFNTMRDDLQRVVESPQGEDLRAFASMCQALTPEARFLASVHLGITIGLKMAQEDVRRVVLQ